MSGLIPPEGSNRNPLHIIQFKLVDELERLSIFDSVRIASEPEIIIPTMKFSFLIHPIKTIPVEFEVVKEDLKGGELNESTDSASSCRRRGYLPRPEGKSG